jgi:FeS assembly SUF system protein
MLMLVDKVHLNQLIIEKLKSIFDPELPVNIYDLGLIYKIDITDSGYVQITMTLTAPSCPAAQSLPVEVDQKIREVEGVTDVNVMITWTPKWEKSMMSEVAALELGFM